ncbi:Serine threonine protein kinase [Lasiodiplodia theobromae]|uniref:Serine threonine protein kinase n=1 Tax=Lasiodiplodia theobromae TaxID=45133 RepID=UPI0015C311E8|nr:Serine threonine protein kinase [Lasiodiplodia theobromae]KAF4538494.1 Serine threonine protein kinase [Lasiodiplodia theobromae]
MEPAKVQKIFTQLVGAVSYIHLKSCVHRDLKLENVLLDKHGNVKLVDFGFTREYEGKSNYLQTWCGTVCYSAPEMLKGEKYAGEKVDVWSLGVIVYALLCGELPFDEDDENETKRRILKEEPKYPDHMPEQAKDLIIKLLSKRPLLRPSLPEILQHPWLAEHAPQQQVILKLQQPPPFTTEIEKETLQRMRSAGVDIDKVIENVLAQRCDALAGWWALLLEKEERKAKRRERKRKEREAEAKSLRRLSAASRASSRLDRLAPTIREIDEEGAPIPTLGEPPKSRGRNRERTSIATFGIAQALVQGVGETRKIQITRRHSEAFYYSDYKHRQTVVPGPTGIAEPRKLRRNAAAPTSFHQSKQWVEQEGISLPSADDAPVILPTQFCRPSRPQASSTSSASLASPSVSSRTARSPHQSVKVLPATPTGTTFPSNIRLVRATAAESAAAFGGLPPPSPGVLFAKRKRSPFKGPALSLNTGGSPIVRGRGEGGSRTSSVQGRKSGELVIEEENEDILEEEEEEDIEEVEAFSPVLAPGEYLEESPQDLNLSEEPPPETPKLAP